MKIQYRKFKDPAMIAMGVWGGDKNRGQKNQINVFDFFGTIFVTHRGFYTDCDGGGGVCGWLGDENRDRKNRTVILDFFNHDFCHPISSINTFENLKFSKMFGEDTICEFEDPAIVMGGNWVTKIMAEKKMKTLV